MILLKASNYEGHSACAVEDPIVYLEPNWLRYSTISEKISTAYIFNRTTPWTIQPWVVTVPVHTRPTSGNLAHHGDQSEPYCMQGADWPRIVDNFSESFNSSSSRIPSRAPLWMGSHISPWYPYEQNQKGHSACAVEDPIVYLEPNWLRYSTDSEKISTAYIFNRPPP